ncbi:MAG TPA: Ig-like domain-containing protein [Gemmatimonadales bacterium]|nr:Ig-like domain-containing protein [Gemmatimonadales bacterium]
MSRVTRGMVARRLLLAAAVAGCARMGPPPGGPPDFRPPELLATIPESLAVIPDFTGWVSFEFNEVISEGGTPNFGTGRGALEQLVLISPDSGVPRVRWHRDRIEVQPRQGWRPNTVYRIEFAPGLSDLSRNTREAPLVLTFTTGAPAPTRYLTGRAVDWVGRRFIPRALIIATYADDSTVYRTMADSTGRFRFGPLPDGDVLLSASIEDGQPDRQLNRSREAWDTVRVPASADSVGEIWAFVRDTLPPRVGQGGATQVDSFTIGITLTQPIDPSLRLGPDAVSILLVPDSVPLPALTALPEAVHDSIYQPIDSMRRVQQTLRLEAARQDSLRRARADSLGIPVATLDSIIADSLARAPAPEPPPSVVAPRAPAVPDTTTRDEPMQDRPPLSPRLLIRVNAVLELGKRYLIEIRGVRAMGGAVADTLRTQLVTKEPPKPAAPDSAAVRDSTAQTDSAATTRGAGTVDTTTGTPAQLPPPPRNVPGPRAVMPARPW